VPTLNSEESIILAFSFQPSAISYQILDFGFWILDFLADG
jgi:hypothetical protein